MKKQSELNNYLDDLLSDTAEETESSVKQQKSPRSDKKLPIESQQSDYNIYTFPSPMPEFYPHEEMPSPSPLASNRYNIERMERLLDDFNRRQQTTASTHTPLATESEHELTKPSAIKQPIYVNETIDPVYKNGILQPHWAEKPFEVVIVTAAGLRIAVPVFSLGAIYAMADSEIDIAKRPKQSALFLGTAEMNHMHYAVVDSCRWLMPEQYAQLSSLDNDYDYFLTHTKSNYGFAVNAVHTTQTLTTEDIKWRKADSKRPWLAGMLKNQKAILVELDVLMQNISDSLT